jgi:hypothetical protein
MARYTISTTNDEEAGITAAREVYNAGKEPEDQLADNVAYVAMVMASAFDSYQKQHGVGAGA